MSGRLPVVFLVDVDDTLLENDRIQNDLREHLEREFGAACNDLRRPPALASVAGTLQHQLGLDSD